jgi:hypothetical protein
VTYILHLSIYQYRYTFLFFIILYKYDIFFGQATSPYSTRLATYTLFKDWPLWLETLWCVHSIPAFYIHFRHPLFISTHYSAVILLLFVITYFSIISFAFLSDPVPPLSYSVRYLILPFPTPPFTAQPLPYCSTAPFSPLSNPSLSNLTLPYYLSIHSTLGGHHHSSKRFHRRDLYRPVPPRHHCSNRSGEGRTGPK